MRQEELNQTSQRGVIVKMPVLTPEMRELDENLKNLKPGFVVDVSNLEKEQAINRRRFYDNGNHHIIGPDKDVCNPGKYALAFSLHPREATSNA